MGNEPQLTGLARRLQELRTCLHKEDFTQLAWRCGARLSAGRLQMPFWDQEIEIDTVTFTARSEGDGRVLDTLSQALIAYYLHSCDGTPAHGTWVAMTELPDGRFYTRAFQSYTGRELVVAFGNDLPRFTRAATRLGGEQISFASVAYRFAVFPHLPVLVACWLGDEEFPPSYKVLFDAHARHQLPTDGCAIIGSALTRRLLKLGQEEPNESSH